MHFVGRAGQEVGFVFTIEELTSLLVAFGMTGHSHRKLHAEEFPNKYCRYSLTHGEEGKLFADLSNILEQVI